MVDAAWIQNHNLSSGSAALSNLRAWTIKSRCEECEVTEAGVVRGRADVWMTTNMDDILRTVDGKEIGCGIGGWKRHTKDLCLQVIVIGLGLRRVCAKESGA